MSRCVNIAELPPDVQARVLEQIRSGTPADLAVVQEQNSGMPAAESSDRKLSFQTLADEKLTDPVLMDNDELAEIVIDGFTKLRPYIPYIITLNQRFRDGERDSLNRLKQPIRGCHSWTEFCRNQLSRTPQAVNKAIRELKPGDDSRSDESQEPPQQPEVTQYPPQPEDSPGAVFAEQIEEKLARIKSEKSCLLVTATIANGWTNLAIHYLDDSEVKMLLDIL